MPDLDTEEFFETDSSDNEENHSKLVSSVSQLDSTQRVKPAQRREIASEVSEFNLREGFSGRKNLVNLKELTAVLGSKVQHGIISKKIEKVTKKSQVLPKPLEKVTEERLKRSIGFENVKKHLGRWDAIVERNSLKDQIFFPLNDSSLKMQRSNDFLSQFKTTTPLEEEIAKVLKQDDIKETEEKEDEFPLTLEEMREKRKELAQLRAKLSYRQAKAMRQSKIKSKKYHRLLKREKIRQQLKEFELLQKTDPEAALKKLSELDRTRAQERASLRHRNTGQWAKNLSVRAKYDVETRKVLADQLKMSRELTQKVSQLESSDDDEEAAGKALPENGLQSESKTVTTFGDNPWTVDVSKEVEDFVSGYKKFWSEQQKEITKDEKETKEEEIKQCNGEGDREIQTEESPKGCEETEKVVKKVVKPEVEKPPKMKSPKKLGSKRKKSSVSIHPASGVWIVTPIEEGENSELKNKRKAKDIDELFEELHEELTAKSAKRIQLLQKKLTRRKKSKKVEKKKGPRFNTSLKSTNIVERPDMDTGLLEGETEDVLEANTEDVAVGEVRVTVPESKAPPMIDPQNFIQVKPKKLRTHLPENITGDEDAIDDEKDQQKIIEEAFGGDDVMAEFQERKAEEEEKDKIEMETSLPGWGNWGGTGIRQRTSRKKRLLVLNLPPRKDKHKKDIIINENENPNVKAHLVKEVPHPFKSVEAFEANIRAPVGRDWVPETAHQKLIQKQVVTKLGTVIDPMDEEAIVRLHKAAKSPYRGKKKTKT